MVIAKKKNASLVQKVLDNKKRLLVVLLFGNNLVNVSIASMTSLWVNEKFANGALGIATGAVTLLILIFGEIFPKAFFQARAEKMALTFVPLIRVLEIIIFPLVFVFEKLLIAVAGDKNREQVSEQEFRALSRIAVENGVFKFNEHEMIMNVLEMGDKVVKEAMTPRYRMSAVNGEAEIDQIAYFMAKEGYSRYPVYTKQEDSIIGYIHLTDVMKVLNSGNREDALSKYVSPIIRVSEKTKISSLFKKMLKQRTHLAVVYRKKQLVGLITLEDILEEIVGEIEDENDLETEINYANKEKGN